MDEDLELNELNKRKLKILKNIYQNGEWQTAKEIAEDINENKKNIYRALCNSVNLELIQKRLIGNTYHFKIIVNNVDDINEIIEYLFKSKKYYPEWYKKDFKIYSCNICQYQTISSEDMCEHLSGPCNLRILDID